MIHLQDTQAFSFTVARLLVCLGIFCLPFSHFFVNKIFFTAIVFAVLAGDWKVKATFVLSKPYILFTLLLLLLLVFGAFYSIAPFDRALVGLGKYGKLLYLCFLLPLFVNVAWRNIALNCFILSMTLAATVSAMGYLHIINSYDLAHTYPLLFSHSEKYNLFIGIGAFSTITALASFFVLHRIADSTRYRWLYIAILLLLLFHLFFINTQRVGWFAFGILLPLFAWQHYRLKGILVTLALLPIIFAGLYTSAPTFQKRMNAIYTNTVSYTQGSYNTSIGLRLSFIDYSIKIIQQNPVFGVGTGGFRYAYDELNGPTIGDDEYLNQPHNEYLFLATQIGLLGLLVFLLWLATLWKAMLHLAPKEKYLAQGLLVLFMFASLVDASLSNNTIGSAFVVLASVLFSSNHNKSR